MYRPRKIVKNMIKNGVSFGMLVCMFMVFGLFAIGLLRYGIIGLIADALLAWVIYDAL